MRRCTVHGVGRTTYLRGSTVEAATGNAISPTEQEGEVYYITDKSNKTEENENTRKVKFYCNLSDVREGRPLLL